MALLFYLGIGAVVATVGLWVANLGIASMLSASEPKPSLSDEWR